MATTLSVDARMDRLDKSMVWVPQRLVPTPAEPLKKYIMAQTKQ